MPDTLPNVVIPDNTWVDLYAATGITVGTRIVVQNIGVYRVFLSVQATEPVTYMNHHVIDSTQCAINEVNDSGAWAYSRGGGCVNVKVFN